MLAALFFRSFSGNTEIGQKPGKTFFSVDGGSARGRCGGEEVDASMCWRGATGAKLGNGGAGRGRRKVDELPTGHRPDYCHCRSNRGSGGLRSVRRYGGAAGKEG